MEQFAKGHLQFAPGETAMLIHEMTEHECGAALEHVSLGRLACARGDQPYIVPVYFSYDGKDLYGVTTPGQKVDWMRANPLVCVEIDQQTDHYHWTSVVVFGRYDEIQDAPKDQHVRAHALELLQNRTLWWEPACVPMEHREPRSPIFFRIHIERVTGRRATPDPVEVSGR